MSCDWRSVVGYEGLYEVSGSGLVRIAKSGKIRRPSLSRGYARMILTAEGVRKTFSVHALVAKAFLPNPGNKFYINHKNGIRNDNRVENLEWCTHSENCIHRYRLLLRINPSQGKRGEKSPTSKQVAQYDLSMQLIRVHPGMREAARATGFNHQNISYCCLGRKQVYRGFIWKYA